MFSDLFFIFLRSLFVFFTGSCMCMLEIRTEILDTDGSELVEYVYEGKKKEAIPCLIFISALIVFS